MTKEQAQKVWGKFDISFRDEDDVYDFPSPAWVSQKSRESYKAALRAEIERYLKETEFEIKEVLTNGGTPIALFSQKRTLIYTLHLIDTVTPEGDKV